MGYLGNIVGFLSHPDNLIFEKQEGQKRLVMQSKKQDGYSHPAELKFSQASRVNQAQDFNKTQPLQAHTVNQNRDGNMGLTQQPVGTTGLQKILRQINKQISGNESKGTAASNNIMRSDQRPPSAKRQAGKSNSGNSQRRTSAKRTRRVDSTGAGQGVMPQGMKVSSSGSSMLPPQFQNQQIKQANFNSHMAGMGGKLPVKASRNPHMVDGQPQGLPLSSNTNPNPITANITMNTQVNNQTNSNLKGQHEDNQLDGPHHQTTIAKSASGKRMKVNLMPNQNSQFNPPSTAKAGQLPSERPPHYKHVSAGNEGHTSKSNESRFANRQNGKLAYLKNEPTDSKNASADHKERRTQSNYLGQSRVNKNLGRDKQDMSMANESNQLLSKNQNRLEANSNERSGLTKTSSYGKHVPSENSGITQLDNLSKDKIQVKLGPGKKQSTDGNSYRSKDGQNLNSLMQPESAADDRLSKKQIQNSVNNFRAKLLKNPAQGSAGTGGIGSLNNPAQLSMGFKAANKLGSNPKNPTSKDEPHIIQNALNSLKQGLSKNEQEEKRKAQIEAKARKLEEKRLQEEREKHLGPDDIVEYRGMKMTVQQREEYIEMEEQQISKFKDNYYPAKYASKKNGVVVTYAANTHQGMVRNYNEDRVSIILNIIKPKFKQIDFWPRCSFFAIYDGHGGADCADFLRDQLHQLIVRDDDFPQNPAKAIERGFQQAEAAFLKRAHNESGTGNGAIQRSGSCAIVILIVGEDCYVANVGDSRAFMSTDHGKKIVPLSLDHKPEEESETKRIEDNGGKIYQNQSFIPDPTPGSATGTQTLIGPHRVFPGRLSVSRTIGDIEAKDVRYGGNPNVVTATPDIRCFRIRDNHDYILIGCDGVFEKMDNDVAAESAWASAMQPEDLRNPSSVHARCGLAVDGVLNACVDAKTLDNITAVLIGFSSFEKLIEKSRSTGVRVDLLRPTALDVETVDLDWEQEKLAIQESDSHRVMQKLLKPLEPVEEEDDLETPLSEIVDVTHKNKINSRAILKANTPSSCATDRYASSSRRQSQLLEATDTQNLDMHNLLNKAGSAPSSQEKGGSVHSSPEQSQPINQGEEEQGIGLKKSATQIGQGVSYNNQQSVPTNSEIKQSDFQGRTLANQKLNQGHRQKDYQIRQTSSTSPARTQSRSVVPAEKQKLKKQELGKAPMQQTLFRSNEQSSQQQTDMSNQRPGVSSGQTDNNYSAAPKATASSSLPSSKSSRAQETTNRGSQKKLAAPGQSMVATQAVDTEFTGNSFRTQTPKRVISTTKANGSRQYDSQQLPHAVTTKNSNYSGQAITIAQGNSRGIKQGSKQTIARDQILPVNQPDSLDDVHPSSCSAGNQPKVNKKMVANWVGSNNHQSMGQSSGFSNSQQPYKSQSSGGHAPPISSSKVYAPSTSQQKTLQGKNKAQSQNRRIADSLQNLIHQTANDNTMRAQHNDMSNDAPHIHASFHSHNPRSLQQPLNLASTSDHQLATNQPPIRSRKKSSKSSQNNHSSLVDGTLNKTQGLNNMPNTTMNKRLQSFNSQGRKLATEGGQSNNNLIEPTLGTVSNMNNQGFQHLPQAIKKQRTSGSRNNPNNFNPSSSSTNKNGRAAGSNQQFIQHTHGVQSNHTVFNNLNQGHSLNSTQPIQVLTSQRSTGGSSHLQKQTSQTRAKMNLVKPGPDTAQTSAAAGKQWYSNTLNLTGIKQLTTTSATSNGAGNIHLQNNLGIPAHQHNSFHLTPQKQSMTGSGQYNQYKRNNGQH